MAKRGQRRARPELIDEGDLNELLLKQGSEVFRNVSGFGQALWARRVGPGDGRDIDFIVINPKNGNVAVVEAALRMTGDLHQLRSYSEWLSGSSAAEIARRVAQAVGLSKGTKARLLANRSSNLSQWLGKDADQGCERLTRRIRKRFGFLLLFLPLSGSRPSRLELLCETALPLQVQVRGGKPVSTRLFVVAAT